METNHPENSNLVPANTATPSLAMRLRNSIPAWVPLDDLDAAAWSMPPVRRGYGDELRAAADAHREANGPASADERRSILRELRLGTMARNESPDEARASFEKLIHDLSDVPADILRSACSGYVNQPGTQFFPRGAGELRAFTQPLVATRVHRAYRLGLMAKECDSMFNDADRCTPDQAAAILEEFGIRGERAKSLKAHLGPPRNPTRLLEDTESK